MFLMNDDHLCAHVVTCAESQTRAFGRNGYIRSVVQFFRFRFKISANRLRIYVHIYVCIYTTYTCTYTNKNIKKIYMYLYGITIANVAISPKYAHAAEKYM